MIRLIDAEALKKLGKALGVLTTNEFYELIDNIPTVDADAIHNEKEQAYYQGYTDASEKYRRPPGRWITTDVLHCIQYCSECRTYFDFKWHFCPNCGADMRESNTNGVDNI